MAPKKLFGPHGHFHISRALWWKMSKSRIDTCSGQFYGAQLVPLNFLIKFPLHDFNFPLSDDLFLSGTTFIVRHDFYFMARLLFSGTTFIFWHDFFSGTTFIFWHDFFFSGTTFIVRHDFYFPARLLFSGTTFFSGTTSVLSDTTFIFWHDFFSLARLLFSGTTFFSARLFLREHDVTPLSFCSFV